MAEVPEVEPFFVTPNIHMNDQAYESLFVTEDYIRIKFKEPIAVLNGRMTSGNFFVYDTLSASPNEIKNPFKEIKLAKDWISTSRQLTLYWLFQLESDHTYRIESKYLRTTYNTPLSEQLVATIVVDDWFSDPPGYPGEESRPTREVTPLDVEDYSIKNPPYTEGATGGGGDGGGGGVIDPTVFSIVSVTPTDSESYQLAPQANEGKIVVEFTKPPASNYLNNSDFKLQRKSLEGVTAWENVNTKVLADSTGPKVNVYLPAQGSIPTYSFETRDEVDVYWTKGYKYRLIISKYVGV